jgi:N-acyl amino acid synthase of PEP-CTERM/exosortase system
VPKDLTDGSVDKHSEHTEAARAAHRPLAADVIDPSSTLGTEHFTFLRVDGTPYLEQCARLRYEVYCRERGFLNPDDYPDGIERDEFDTNAIHFACLSRRSEAVVGTIRLVAPVDGRFPLSSHCSVNPALLPPNTMEISRLAVSRQYRRRADDNEYGLSQAYLAHDPESNERRRRPEIVLGLYKIMYRESKRIGVRAWLAAMEHSLARLLSRFSFHFEAVGPEVDYYGPVTPYLARIDAVEKIVSAVQPALYAEFTDSVITGHEP